MKPLPATRVPFNINNPWIVNEEARGSWSFFHAAFAGRKISVQPSNGLHWNDVETLEVGEAREEKRKKRGGTKRGYKRKY